MSKLNRIKWFIWVILFESSLFNQYIGIMFLKRATQLCSNEACLRLQFHFCLNNVTHLLRLISAIIFKDALEMYLQPRSLILLADNLSSVRLVHFTSWKRRNAFGVNSFKAKKWQIMYLNSFFRYGCSLWSKLIPFPHRRYLCRLI